MNEVIIEQALETFRRLLPWTRVYVDSDEMRYTFHSKAVAKHFEREAQDIIIRHHLPLEADVAEWSMGDYVFEVQLVVKFVQEMHMIPCY